jgi:hypothetical protein
MAVTGEGIFCGTCNGPYDDEVWIYCDTCLNHYHIKCQNLIVEPDITLKLSCKVCVQKQQLIRNSRFSTSLNQTDTPEVNRKCKQ